MIKIFNSNDKSYTTNGNIAIQPSKCIETKNEGFSGWEVDVEVNLKYKDFIAHDNIILVPTKSRGEQPFRIQNPEITQRNIKFRAIHVAFDTSRYLIHDIYPQSLNGSALLDWINTRTDRQSPFTTISDVSNLGTARIIRKTLQEAFLIAQERVGGFFDFNKWEIKLLSSIGLDRGETIRYGKNLQGIRVYENWGNVCTKLLPIGPNGVTLPEVYLYSDVQYDEVYAKVISFEIQTNEGEELAEDEMVNRLRSLGEEHLEKNKYPEIHYEVQADVDQTLDIGDTVYTVTKQIEVPTRVQGYVYDANKKRVTKLVYGNFNRDVRRIFNTIREDINHAIEASSTANKLVQEQSNIINQLGKLGHVYQDDNEIMVLDSLPKETAQNVLKISLGGIGFSSTGIEGPFPSAWTLDGKFNASFIQTGILNASLLKAGMIQSPDGLSYWNLDNGEIVLNVQSLKINTKSVATETDIQNIELTPGPQGPPGDPGTNGISVTDIDVMYYLSTSATILSGGTWSTTAHAWINGKFIWTKTVTSYSDGSQTESNPVNITGAKGDVGTGIESITEEYYLSTSKTTQTGGSWVTSPPVWSIGKYLWTRSKIVYNNPTSTAYTIPVVSSEWEAVNGLIPRFEANETSISTNSTNIGLRALKTEVEGPIYKQTTAPPHLNGRLWLNTSVTPNQLKRSTGSIWVNITPTSGAEIGLSDAQITSKVESNSTVLAKKSEVTQMDDTWTAKFSQIGGANLIRNSSELPLRLVGWEDNNPQITSGITVPEWGTNEAYRIYIPGVPSGTSDLRAYCGIPLDTDLGYLDNIPHTFSIYVKNNRPVGGSTVTIDSHRFGSTTIEPQESRRVFMSGSNSSTRSPQLQIETNGAAWLVDITVWRPQLEKGWVGTEWTPHPEELYTGVTRIDQTGINVSESDSTINTHISNDGLTIKDGSKNLASFGDSGAVIPVAEIGDIKNDRVARIINSGSYTVGSGGNYSNMSSLMGDVFKDGDVLSRGLSISIKLTSNLSERILVAGIHGCDIIIDLNGRTLYGTVKVAFSSARVLIHNGTIKSKGDTALLAVGAPATELLNTNIDGGGVQYPVYADKSSNLLVRGCDFVNCRWGPHATNNSTIHAYDNRGNVDYSYRASWAGTIFVYGSVPRGALGVDNVIRGWSITSAVVEADSTYIVPPITNETFTQTFTSAIFDTLLHGTSTINNYFGASAAQNRWGSNLWNDGRIRLNSAIYDFFEGGSNITIKYKLRRKNTSHGISGAVKPEPYNHSASFATGAIQGGWTSEATLYSGVSSATADNIFTSSGATLLFYSGVTNDYAIWDAISVTVTVTKQV